ncbi:MAG TPA: hypothetical protein VFM54_24465 [Micromonosporaceae bacterium]|nr:hypothetical protein [Micromonosporaceae bacterium]
MSVSWGHQTRPLTGAERQLRMDELWPCARPGCAEWPTHEVSYQYRTGRAGRVATGRRKVCDAHAEQFRVSYLGGADVPG